MRKLAKIVTIDNIRHLENSENLNIAEIGGWEIVINKKENFVIGGKAIYCEIDSNIPIDKDWLPDAIKEMIKTKKLKKFILKTKKIRGVVSQGLLIPFSESISELENLDLETDVTEILGITKYEKIIYEKICNSSNSKISKTPRISNFPLHLVPKTDELRIQSNKKLLNEFLNKEYYCTLKLDGCSSTFVLDDKVLNDDKGLDDNFLVCSRNYIAEDEGDFWNKMAKKYDIKTILKLEFEKGNHLALQGEICGPKIQKNLLNLNTLELFIFNIYDCKNKIRFNHKQIVDFCNNYNLKYVPLIESGDNFCYDIKELLELTKGFYENTKNHREGLVFRNDKYSFKVINNDYLLKYDS